MKGDTVVYVAAIKEAMIFDIFTAATITVKYLFGIGCVCGYWLQHV